MNILRDEDNAKYRLVMKNTLEFDPEILKRYVNFMNNPDERTAVDQFGKGDKYFGICTLMATLPGLPMFGHGQIEGLAEKYGMEYRRAYWDEQPDPWLVERHEREISPLLHRRYLFAGVDNFLLYDFFAPEGYVNEDVFAYSNRMGDERSLVIYHNKYAGARGWVKTSVAYSVKTGQGDERRLTQKTLGEGLGLRADDNGFCIFRDSVTGLEYIRNGKQLCDQGLYVELGAYKCHVFLDWREVLDNEWHQYAHLADYLDGRGVPSVDEAMKELFLQPIHVAFKELVNADVFRRLMAARVLEPDATLDAELVEEVEQKTVRLLSEIKRITHSAGDEAALAREMRQDLEAILQLPVLETPESAASLLKANLDDDMAIWGTAFGWCFVRSLGKVAQETNFQQQSRSWIDEWLLGKLMARALADFGLDETEAWRAVGVVKLLTTHQRWFETKGPKEKRAYQVLEAALQDGEIQQFIQVNRWQGTLWFNKESLERWLWWMLLIAEVDAQRAASADEVVQHIAERYAVIAELMQAEEQSEYQVEKLLEAVKVTPSGKSSRADRPPSASSTD
jgi:hypothetical protein